MHSAAFLSSNSAFTDQRRVTTMAEKKVTCECGKEFRSANDDQLVSDVQKHAREVHNMELSREQVLSMAQ
jgi:predicted small metal-binding protein